jgi:hypothetical protein
MLGNWVSADFLANINRLDTICNYIFNIGPPGTHLHTNYENILDAGRHVVSFGGLSIDFPGGPR